MSSRDDRSRPKSEKKSSKHKLPSITVQLPVAARSAPRTPSNPKVDRKKQEKVEKKKKQLQAATVTLSDLRRQENALIIPDDTRDIENVREGVSLSSTYLTREGSRQSTAPDATGSQADNAFKSP